MPNDTVKTILARWSCRAFTGEMPSGEDLRTVAGAAVAAPSGMNRQPWRVVVVKNKALIGEMEAEGMRVLASLADKSAYERIRSRGGRLFYNAPCMIVVPVPSAGTPQLDCGILTENIAIAAASLGIDSLICGLAGFCFAGEKSEGFKSRLGFPEGYEFGIAVLLGHAAGPGRPHEPDMGKISFVE